MTGGISLTSPVCRVTVSSANLERALAKIEETLDSLHAEIGMPRFNGTIIHLDAKTRTLSLQMTNLFIRSKPAKIPFDDITEMRIMGSHAAAYLRLLVRGGKAYNMPSFSSPDAIQAVQRIQAFLAAHSVG